MGVTISHRKSWVIALRIGTFRKKNSHRNNKIHRTSNPQAFSDMTKFHKLTILAFILGYALLAQGTPTGYESDLENVENDPEQVDSTTPIERGNRVRREKADGRPGPIHRPYSYHMKDLLKRRKLRYPNLPNIVIVRDGADYETDQYSNGHWEYIEGYKYLIYQWKGNGYFWLKSDGGWKNWAYSGYLRDDIVWLGAGKKLYFKYSSVEMVQKKQNDNYECYSDGDCSSDKYCHHFTGRSRCLGPGDGYSDIGSSGYGAK